MSTADQPHHAHAHSLAEAYFYIMVTPCTACGEGSLQGGEGRRSSAEDAPLVVAIDAACKSCQHQHALQFALPLGAGEASGAGVPVVNPGDSPSEIIDVAQWLTLFRVVTESAYKERNKQAARRLGIEAAQCLEEALKFYDDADNDLPPASALFHDESRKRLREHPEEFSRQRLYGLRDRLPSLARMQSTTKAAGKRPRKWWWPF